jgi:hypothetical protein
MGFLGNLLGGILGGASASKTGKDNEKLIQELRTGDQEFNTAQWDKASLYNRPNQYSDYGSLTWGKDPTTGQMTQTNTMNPAEQARLGDFRAIAADRMGAARGMSMTSPNINYNAFPSQAASTWKGPQAGTLNQYDPFASFAGPTGGGAALGGGQPQSSSNPVNFQAYQPPTGPSAGGAALAPAPAPSAPAAPAAPQMSQEDIWKYIQEQQALKDNLWSLNSQNSSPGQ